MAFSAEINRLVICEDPDNCLPLQYDSSVFVTPSRFAFWVRNRVFNPTRISNIDCQTPVNLPSPFISAFLNLKSLTMNGLNAGSSIDLSVCERLTSLSMMEVGRATIILSPGLRTCKLSDHVRIQGNLPETLQTLVFADDKDWTIPPLVEHLHFTGDGNDLTIPGSLVKTAVAKYANLCFTGDCNHLEEIVSESAVVFPDCALPRLRLYIASDIPPSCPNLKYYGLYFGDNSLANPNDLDPDVAVIVDAAKARFSGANHIFVSPPNLVEGCTSFLCRVDPAHETLVRVAVGEPLSDRPIFEFVVEDIDEEVDYMTVGELPEAVDADSGDDTCSICFDKMVEPETIYSCGIHPLCRVCAAKAKQITFPIISGLPGAPELEHPHLQVCPICRSPKGAKVQGKRSRE